MVYSTKRFVVCLSVCHFVLVFSVLLVLRLPRLGKGELISVLSYVCSVCACLDLSVSSSSLGLGRAAVCDCGTPWTFLLPFFFSKTESQIFDLIVYSLFAKAFFSYFCCA